MKCKLLLISLQEAEMYLIELVNVSFVTFCFFSIKYYVTAVLGFQQSVNFVSSEIIFFYVDMICKRHGLVRDCSVTANNYSIGANYYKLSHS